MVALLAPQRRATASMVSRSNPSSMSRSWVARSSCSSIAALTGRPGERVSSVMPGSLPDWTFSYRYRTVSFLYSDSRGGPSMTTIVLLAGATGMLGDRIARHLLDQPGVTVRLLIRATALQDP